MNCPMKLSKKTILVSIVLELAVPFVVLAQNLEPDFYVAVNGNDSWSGKLAQPNNSGTDGPFATIPRARDAVRAQKANADLKHPVTVLLRGGLYTLRESVTFGPEDSGTENYPITYAAFPGEKVVLSGGQKITGWKKGPSEIWTTEFPEVKARNWYFRQLFVNGRRAIRARTPNTDDKMPWWTIKTSTATKESPPQKNEPITVSITGSIQGYRHPNDIELIYMQNNESGRKRLRTINEIDQTFTLAPPHRWNPRAFINDWYLSIPFAGKPCYLENALEMLDQPGEWYLDRQTGVLTYWPCAGEDLTSAEVIAPVAQKTLLAIIGTPQQPVRNLHFKELQVRYLDWPLPPWGYMPMFCCNVAVDGDPNPGHRPIEAAVEFEYARSCSFTNGGISHVGGMGLCLRNGTANIIIEGNDIFDLGGGGITAGYPNVGGGFLYAAPPPKPGEYQGYRIANNYVHHCGMDYYGAVGILLFATQNAQVAHNLIHDTAYFGMGVAGSQDPELPFARDNTIEFNHIYHAMKVTIDGAGMYVTFANHGNGTLIRGNLIHDTQGNPYHEKWGVHPPSAGIYLDSNNSGCRYESNVLYQNLAAGPLIFNYPDAQTQNIWIDNLFFKEEYPPQEFIEVMQACTGLEPAYQKSILNQEPNPCQCFPLTDPTAHLDWTACQFHLPQKNQGIIQIIQRTESRPDTTVLQLRSLDPATSYQMNAYAGTLAPASVWGPGSMNMLSNLVPLPLSSLGLDSANDKTIVTGRELLEKGLTLRMGKTDQILWITYQRIETF
jgi:hypothetical protein